MYTRCLKACVWSRSAYLVDLDLPLVEVPLAVVLVGSALRKDLSPGLRGEVRNAKLAAARDLVGDSRTPGGVMSASVVRF